MNDLNWAIDEFETTMAINHQESAAYYARKATNMLQELENASRYGLAHTEDSAKYFQGQSAAWYASSFRLRGLVD